jgi:hypothetical protein
MSSSDRTVWGLGKPIWSRTYVVFDAVNNEMAVAPVVYDSSLSRMTSFAYNGAEIPNSIDVASPSSPSSSYPTPRYRSGSQAGPLIIVIVLPIVIFVSCAIGVGGSIMCCWRQGLLCFKRNRAQRDAIARHAATAGGMGWPMAAPYQSLGTGTSSGEGHRSDVLLATGGPSLQEKNIGGMAGVFAPTADDSDGGSAMVAAPLYQTTHMLEQPVLPLAYSAPQTPPPTTPLPPLPVAARAASPTGDAQVLLPPVRPPSPKGKGKATDVE